MTRPIIILAALLMLAACAGSKTEMPANDGEGTDYMRKSPCACEQLDFDGRGFQWIG